MADDKVLTTTIANTATTSATVDLGDLFLCGVEKPDNVAGTTIAFQVSANGIDFVPMVDVSFACANNTAQFVPVPIETLAGVRWIRVVMGSAQAGARTLTLHVQRL